MHAAAVTAVVWCVVVLTVALCVCMRLYARALPASCARFRKSFALRDLKSEGGFVVRVQSVFRAVCVRVVLCAGSESVPYRSVVRVSCSPSLRVLGIIVARKTTRASLNYVLVTDKFGLHKSIVPINLHPFTVFLAPSDLISLRSQITVHHACYKDVSELFCRTAMELILCNSYIDIICAVCAGWLYILIEHNMFKRHTHTQTRYIFNIGILASSTAPNARDLHCESCWAECARGPIQIVLFESRDLYILPSNRAKSETSSLERCSVRAYMHSWFVWARVRRVMGMQMLAYNMCSDLVTLQWWIVVCVCLYVQKKLSNNKRNEFRVALKLRKIGSFGYNI